MKSNLGKSAGTGSGMGKKMKFELDDSYGKGLTSLDDQEKVDRAAFTRKLPDGRTIKVKATRAKRPGR